MKTIPKIVAAMFAVFLALQVIVYSNLYAFNGVDASKLDNYLNNLEKDNSTMLSVSVADQGTILYQRSIGYMDELMTRKSSHDTPYRIGELSKTFTAVMVMQMIDEKRIQLGTPLSRFFPEIPNAKNISIEDLLTERLDIRNYLDGGKYYLPVRNDVFFDEQVSEDRNADQMKNASFGFSDANYMVLGMIIEKISGKKYADVLKERITDPLGLNHTTDAATGSDVACSFSQTNGGWIKLGQWDLTSLTGSASIVSTPEDLVTFITAVFNGELISSRSLEKMLFTETGIGLKEMFFQNRAAYGSSGNMQGYVSQFIYFPAEGISVCYVMNAWDSSHFTLMQDIVKNLFQNS